MYALAYSRSSSTTLAVITVFCVYGLHRYWLRLALPANTAAPRGRITTAGGALPDSCRG